jgi:hypothetical protein
VPVLRPCFRPKRLELGSCDPAGSVVRPVGKTSSVLYSVQHAKGESHASRSWNAPYSQAQATQVAAICSVSFGLHYHESWKHFIDLAYWNVELGEDFNAVSSGEVHVSINSCHLSTSSRFTIPRLQDFGQTRARATYRQRSVRRVWPALPAAPLARGSLLPQSRSLRIHPRSPRHRPMEHNECIGFMKRTTSSESRVLALTEGCCADLVRRSADSIKSQNFGFCCSISSSRRGRLDRNRKSFRNAGSGFGGQQFQVRAFEMLR